MVRTDAQMRARRDALPQSQCWLTWLGAHSLHRGRAQKRCAQCNNSSELPWHYFTRLLCVCAASYEQHQAEIET